MGNKCGKAVEAENPLSAFGHQCGLKEQVEDEEASQMG